MENIKNYFNAEKYESVFFVGFGLIAIAFAIYFRMGQKNPLYRGMTIPLALVALIQLTVGTTVWMRSPKDIERVEQIINKEPSRITTEEIPRMKVVEENFVIYRWVEIALLLVGLVCMFAFTQHQFIRGVGIGLFIQSALMLSLDFLAEKRAEEYLSYLLTL
jgi:hypothetical protein